MKSKIPLKKMQNLMFFFKFNYHGDIIDIQQKLEISWQLTRKVVVRR